MNYTLKFKFSTAKLGRGSSIKGDNGNAECDITTDYTLEDLKTKINDLISIAYNSIKDNSKVKKMGKIINIDIIDIIVK